MTMTITLGWWMLPLTAIWIFYGIAAYFQESWTEVSKLFLGVFLLTFVSLLTRFLP